MPEWLYEAGIGEERAALVEDGDIIEARIEPERETAWAGAIVEAKLSEILPNKRAGRLKFANGEGALIEPLPKGITEGAPVFVEIVRERIAENWGIKLAKARHHADVSEPRAALSLRKQIERSEHPVHLLASHEPDILDKAGWSELLEQAQSGIVRFAGGTLRIALTPAMTVIDVDGALSPAELAIAGAHESAKAIRRLGIAGSIGIDLPTLESKADRQAAAAVFDETLPQPFERTAVNGFGFLQVVRKRVRPSLLELAQNDMPAWAARSLLRTSERSVGSGERVIAAQASTIAFLNERANWIGILERRLGTTIELKPDDSLDQYAAQISAAYP